jgi:F0F1-type ATP synthase membrane subunit b/b'
LVDNPGLEKLVMTEFAFINLLDWQESLNAWANIPGLEVWKFFNLTVFVLLLTFLVKGKISAALASRRETIKLELAKAHEEREIAHAKLSEAESKLAHLDDDVRGIQENAKREAAAESERLAAATSRELEKIKQQADRELEAASRVAKRELQEFLAAQSIEKARAVVIAEVRPEDDMRIINESISELRRARA